MNRTAVKLSLASFGGGWMPQGETGNLRVRAINTGGGMYMMDEVHTLSKIYSGLTSSGVVGGCVCQYRRESISFGGLGAIFC